MGPIKLVGAQKAIQRGVRKML